MINGNIEKLELEVLTPMHIGDVETKKLGKLSYIYEDNKIKIISEEKFIDFLFEKNLYNQFEEYLKGGNKALSIKGFFDKYKVYDYKDKIFKEEKSVNNVIDKSAFATNITYSANNRGKSKKSISNEINLFFTDGNGDRYIPGSTLKNVIVGAIKNKKLENSSIKLNYNELESNIKELSRYGKDIKSRLMKEEKEVREKIIDDDLARYIQVSDSEIIDGSNTFIAQKEDLTFINNKSKINSISTYREYLKPGTKIRFNVKINYDKLKGLNINSIEDIFKLLQERINNIEDLEDILSEKADISIKKSYNELEPNAIIGGGTGFVSKSFIYKIGTDRKRTIKIVARYLDSKFKDKNNHNHVKNDYLLSPRTLKLVTYDNKKYLVGRCNIRKV